MIELLINIVIDFVLFSLIEGIIFCMFFNIIGNCKKFKWWEIGILSLVNCIVSQTLPPVIYQIIGLIYMGFYIYFRDKINIKNAIKIILFVSLYTLILETLYMVVFDSFGIYTIFVTNDFKLFILMIPIRVIEITILKLGGKKWRKIVSGGMETTLNASS